MSDLKYVVDLELNVSGVAQQQAKASDLAKAWSRLGDEARTVGGHMSGAFTGAVERAGSLALSMAKIGAAAGIAGAVYGVTNLNNQLEQTQVSIAAVLNAQGQAGSMAAGMEKAGSLVAQMKKDAKDLPGEFSDLLTIFQSGVGSAGNAGIDAIKFEKMAAQAMAAGKAMSVPLDQAGRELAQLLEGRAGAHNVFGSRLGIKADGFNKLDPEKRVEKVQAALERFQPAIKQFGGTFDAIWSSALDNAKAFGTQATGPLFGRVKQTLSDINKWFDENQGTVSTYANRIGYFLVDAFEWGKRTVQEWWPAISTFAEHAYERITQIWRDAAPTVKAFGESLKEFLKDDGSIDKIITVLKLYAGVKGGGAVLGEVGGLASAGFGVYQSYQMSQLLAGAGAAGGGQAALGTGTAAAGAAGTGVLAAAATTAAVALAALASVGAAVWQGMALYDDIQHDAISTMHAYQDSGMRVVDSAQESGKSLGVFGESLIYNNEQYQTAMQGLIEANETAAASALMAAAAMATLGGTQIGKDDNPDVVDQSQRYIGLMNTSGMAGQFAKEAKNTAAKALGGHGKGGGGTMKVEITISSNQAPGQIARKVVDELQNLRRHPRSSRYTNNYSAASRG